jgi:hypothetical protein
MATSVSLVGANVAAAAIAVRAAQAMAPTVPASVNADAELIELCRRWLRFNRAYDHLYDRAGPLEDVDEERYDMLQALAGGIFDRKMVPLTRKIADMQASSWSGVAAKAGVLASDRCFAYAGDPSHFPCALEPVLASLVWDAVRLGGMSLPMRVKARHVEV